MARLKRILKYLWSRILRYLTNRPPPSIVELRSTEQLANYMYDFAGQMHTERDIGDISGHGEVIWVLPPGNAGRSRISPAAIAFARRMVANIGREPSG
ncbi:hypothetical protein LTS02_007184 [Friedmanniomyces endolithicus]|nr:hypothetical protein LTS02_007184 [Friedmanniomyces endolithicus]KAK1088769.1 hypothetical protein LTR33_000384 [Friedmanniomyces endolithicus]